MNQPDWRIEVFGKLARGYGGILLFAVPALILALLGVPTWVFVLYALTFIAVAGYVAVAARLRARRERM